MTALTSLLGGVIVAANFYLVWTNVLADQVDAPPSLARTFTFIGVSVLAVVYLAGIGYLISRPVRVRSKFDYEGVLNAEESSLLRGPDTIDRD